MNNQIQLLMTLKNGVSAPLKQIHQQTNTVTKGFDTLKGKMKGLEMGFKGLIGAMAIGEIVNVGKELLEASKIQEQAEQKVNDSLYANMKARGESQANIDKEVQAYKDLASELQSTGVIGDEVTLSGMAMATQMGLTAEQVKDMTPLVQDLAVKQEGLNVSVESYSELNKNLATMVNMGKLGLQKYGIEVTDVEKKQFKAMNRTERYQFIMNKLKDSVAGVNKKMAETPDGKLARINNEIGDIKEQLGKELGKLMLPMLEPLLKFTKWLNNDFSKALDFAKNKVSEFVEDNKEYFKVFKDILRVWIGFFDGFVRNVGTILDGLKMAFTGAFRLIMSIVKLDFGGMWDGLTMMVKGACEAIGGFIKGLANGVIGAFAEMIGAGEEWREEQERLQKQAKFAENPNNYSLEGSIGGVKHNALGTSYFKGGLTHINERNAGEIVNLPNGSQIIPHDVAVKQSNAPVYNVNVNIQGNVIGNEDYANEIGNSIVTKLQLAYNNM